MTFSSLHRRFILVFFFCALPLLCFAKEEPTFTLLSAGDAVSRTVTLEYFKGAPVLIAFWRSDCAPCVQEKPVIDAIAIAHPDLKIALVSLEGAAYSMRHIAYSRTANVETLFAVDDAEQTLKSMGDRRSALPFSVFLRADGSTCETRDGLLGTHMVDEWVKKC